MTINPSEPLSYMGIDEREQPRFLKAQRNPTINDKLFSGTQWENTLTNVIYITTGEGIWEAIVGAAPGIETLTGNTGGAIPPTSGNINILGAGGITVGGSGNTLTVTGSTELIWNNNATTLTMVVDNGYIVTTGAQVFTLPVSSAVGDSIQILLNGGTSWGIAQAAGQFVVINASITTVGVGGSITSNAAGQAIKLICVSPNTGWQTTSLIGNPEVV